ncbi:MAG TPA: glycine betaine ABC transporter substrate-binding protein [Ureibacillus sp.]|nr:glycine betaine ABC transporter substrate-binding protein [Ureibacillus sp.]
MKYFKNIRIITAFSFILLLAACGSSDGDAKNGQSTEENNLGEALDYTITGIEPGAGLTGLAKNALEEYDNLEGWTLLESSTVGMIAALDDAIKNEEPIIVTGWVPHWKFTKYDLKILEDPKGTLGETEQYQTLVRKDLEEDMPEAYQILDRFYWEVNEVESILIAAQDVSFEEAAKSWTEQNTEKVNEWTEGVGQVEGEQIEIVSTPWDTERASANVLKVVLEQQGYSVTITPVDPAIMFQAIATGNGDVSVAAALPITHGPFYEKYKEDIVDLGANLEGIKNGFVVPSYMEIDSIEDLMPKK